MSTTAPWTPGSMIETVVDDLDLDGFDLLGTSHGGAI
jgi:hypothetical protein